MSKVDIWMPIYIGDYIRDTQELTTEEHGVYFLLLMHYWQKSGVIGNDIDRLARVAKTDSKTAQYVLENYFYLQDDNYKNKRADEEMDAAARRSEAGRENAMKRWDGDAKVMPSQCHGNAIGNAKTMPKRCSSSSSSSKDIDTVVSIVEPPNENGTKLYHVIKTRFETMQPQGRFTSYPKEGKAIHGLLDKARARAPDAPDVFLEGMIRTFEYLRETDKFYRSQPFLPSALNSSGIWDRVLNAAEQRWKEEQAALRYDAAEVPL